MGSESSLATSKHYNQNSHDHLLITLLSSPEYSRKKTRLTMIEFKHFAAAMLTSTSRYFNSNAFNNATARLVRERKI